MKGLPTAVSFLVLLSACSSGDQTTTTTPSAAARSPEAVATAVLDALVVGDAQTAAANTIEEQMVWLAMAEGASLQEAAGLLDDGADSVAVNYWTGFTQLGEVPPVTISSIMETMVGDHMFAIVSLGGTDDLRLVLRSEPDWKIDVVASFGSTLAARLADAVEVVAANSGDGADRLRLVLGNQRDSVDIASADTGLNETARQALADLAESLENMSS
ncbi:MAG TPA: hypothetical protein VM848_18685 [Acidimicrobiia bacterium]|nr:hypothetical protein [Acidimicrobiia bacterium]